MGSTLAWRDDRRDHDDRRVSSLIRFGGGRGQGTGYMCRSDRVGPSVLLIHDAGGLTDDIVRLADFLADEGFTVLAPDLVADSGSADLVSRVRDAADHLVANWHPRLGVVAIGEGRVHCPPLFERQTVDAVVVYGSDVDVDVPLLVLSSEDADAHDATVDFLQHHLS